MRFALFIILTSCNFSEQLENKTSPATHFEWLSQNLFQPSCITCHNGATRSGNVDLSSYEMMMASKAHGDALIVPKNIGASELYQCIAQGRMPPRGSISVETMKSLRCWIENGAGKETLMITCGDVTAQTPPPSETPEPTAGPTPPPSTTPPLVTQRPVVFREVFEQVIQKNCVGRCHNADEEIDLSTYDKVMERVMKGKPEESKLYLRLFPGKERVMPPPPRKPLSDADKELIKEWINQGAKLYL